LEFTVGVLTFDVKSFLGIKIKRIVGVFQIKKIIKEVFSFFLSEETTKLEFFMSFVELQLELQL
jgi:hypothetical protein